MIEIGEVQRILRGGNRMPHFASDSLDIDEMLFFIAQEDDPIEALAKLLALETEEFAEQDIFSINEKVT